MLVTMKKLLDVAKGKGFAVPAPNVFSLETTEAAYQAARELNAPVILNVWDDGTEWIEKQASIALYLEKKYPDVIAALNLDHGQSFASEMAAIRSGFTSVMSDRSMMPLEDNIKEVRKIVEAAHAANVSVEAELGHVGQGYEYAETRDQWLTDPAEAVEFAKQTGCDMLAVAVGTSHGAYKGTPRIDFDLLEELNRKIDIPLVLHGGSGTGEENLAKAVQIGIQKVNLCTDLFNGFISGVHSVSGKEEPDFLEMYFTGIEGWKNALKHYIKLFGAEGKASLYQPYAAQPEEKYYAENRDGFVVQK